MKNSKHWSNFILFVILPGILATMAHGKQPLPLRQETRDALRQHEKDFPSLAEAQLPESPVGTSVPLDSVPRRAQDHAMRWIRIIVQPKWLPVDAPARLTALKDARVWEKKDAQGIVFSEIVGDYLLLDYEIEGHGFHIQESGNSMTIRIDFPEERNIANNAIDVAGGWLQEYFNMSIDSIKEQKLRSEDITPLVRVTSQKKRLKKIESERFVAINWWEPINLLTDGRSLVVFFGEAEPGGHVQARPGPPDRF